MKIYERGSDAFSDKTSTLSQPKAQHSKFDLTVVIRNPVNWANLHQVFMWEVRALNKLQLAGDYVKMLRSEEGCG